MSKLITGSRLKSLVTDSIVLKSGNIENCEAIKYDFVLSDDFLKANYGMPADISELKTFNNVITYCRW